MVMGHVVTAGAGMNPARQAALHGGLPKKRSGHDRQPRLRLGRAGHSRRRRRRSGWAMPTA